MDVKNLLDKEIERLLSHIETLEYGTDGREAAISELTKLYKLRIDEVKNEQDYMKDCERQAMERAFHEADDQAKREQLSDQGVERYFRYGVMVLELVLPIAAYGMWYHKGLKFEETGTVTSPMTKNLIAKMLPKKK